MDESSPASSGHGALAELGPWEIALAERVVRGFLATRQPFGALAFEDLVQECLTHWWLQRPRYLAERGASRATFMRRVIEAKLLDIERGERAAKRGGRTQPLSLDAAPGSDEDGPTLAELLPDDDPNWSPAQATERLALRSHLERVLPLLSRRQRQLVDALDSGSSMSEIGRLLQIPRATLYDELDRIRKVFRDESLEEFLE
jgi:RNA polymerase sigma-70 factor (ECF subfamily)